MIDDHCLPDDLVKTSEVFPEHTENQNSRNQKIRLLTGGRSAAPDSRND